MAKFSGKIQITLKMIFLVLQFFCVTLSFGEKVNFVYDQFYTQRLHQNRPYIKSTISQKLKVPQKKLKNKKIIFRAMCIFPAYLATSERLFLVDDTLGALSYVVNTISNNLKNKNRKFFFSFVSAHCASFIPIWPLLMGVCISLIGTGPNSLKIS